MARMEDEKIRPESGLSLNCPNTEPTVKAKARITLEQYERLNDCYHFQPFD